MGGRGVGVVSRRSFGGHDIPVPETGSLGNLRSVSPEAEGLGDVRGSCSLRQEVCGTWSSRPLRKKFEKHGFYVSWGRSFG